MKETQIQTKVEAKEDGPNQAKGRLIELAKRQVNSGAHENLTALERNYLGLALGTDLSEKQIAQQLGKTSSSAIISLAKIRAFTKIFQSESEETKKEVENLFIMSGLGRISPFKRSEYDKAYRERPEVKKRGRACKKASSQRPEVKKRARERVRTYMQRPEVKERIRRAHKEKFKSIDREMAVLIVHQATVDGRFSLLSQREIQVMKARYPEKSQSLEELGEDMGGITRERVRQIEVGALKKLLRAQITKPIA